MEHGGVQHDRFGLPEEKGDRFDERALEEAIRANRRREFAALAELNG